MTDVRGLLAAQAAWQRGLRALTWAEKVRMVERVLPGLRLLRHGVPSPAAPRSGTTPGGSPRRG